jgi:hypothetical protein
MTDKESGFAPASPSVGEEPPAPKHDEPTKPEDDAKGASTEAKSEQPAPPRAPRRQFLRAAWLLVAVVAVAGALTVVELVRIATALNTSACIQRAQADFQEALGPGVSSQFAGLDRLSGQNQLRKCGP